MRQTPEGEPWSDQFARERERLVAALGMMPDGGIVAWLEHVGATSVPGLLGQPCVDIALHVWPFPLEEAARQALSSLGYKLDTSFAGAPEQRFSHSSAAFHLHVVDVGSPLWMDYQAMREYLRHDAAARQAFSDCKREWTGNMTSGGYSAAKRQWLAGHLPEARRSWISREGFAPLRSGAAELRALPVPWYISSGWALDLFLGRVTRVHGDVDVIVSRADQLAMRQFMTERGWKLLTPFEQRLEFWPPHMRLEPPRFQVHAHRDGAFIDVLLTTIENGVWRYRRQPAIIRDTSRAWLRSDDGIDYLAPELALLFKSSTSSGATREKDLADFDATYTHLEPERRAWLRWALTAVNPSHPWLDRL